MVFCFVFTDVQHVPMDLQMGWEPKRIQKDLLLHHQRELSAVQSLEGDPQPTDVQRLCGRLSGQKAKSGGLEIHIIVYCFF